MDIINETILLEIDRHQSFREIAAITGKSLGTIHMRVKALVQDGYILPPARPGLARSYRLTLNGITYLKERGVL